ncbi:CBS domain-containing protein [Thalassobacillus cyri]|uniref:CBS domain-containing protein n=1 Tax=Thalassobacillus cyri TaxID=571932 RepID=A0A1H4GVI4_9BACI|nr:cyclic di-AMP binding protein CbpA [Thalassobacillus cyri]SEB13564.1 CBS domain-containing protein [Thalassobacillus cyri]
MLVKNNVIPKHRVITIHAEATMKEAKQALDKSGYRCIPVVNSNGEYRGMIFRSRIERHENECFRSGEIPDENEHITNVLAYPKTYVYEETSFPQALLRVKALPFIAVLDKRGKFVGILTHNKVFDLLEQAFGLHAGDYIVTIVSPEKHGAVAQLSKMLNKRGINIEGLMTFDDDGSKVVRRLCITVSNVTKAQLSELFAKLERKGYRVLRSEQIEKNDHMTRTILED